MSDDLWSLLVRLFPQINEGYRGLLEMPNCRHGFPLAMCSECEQEATTLTVAAHDPGGYEYAGPEPYVPRETPFDAIEFPINALKWSV